MKLLNRVQRYLKHPEIETDIFEDNRTLEEKLLEAEAHLARVQELPPIAFRPKSMTPNELINNYNVSNETLKRNAIAYAKADVAELKILIEGKEKI